MNKQGYKKLGFATIDIHRERRCGFPEVIFCQNKEPADVARIAREILKHSKCLLATRADKKVYQAVKKVARDAVYHPRARVITISRIPRKREGLVLVVSA
ncbi:MAG: 1-(5-phosphoribosyl)-5-amino-4-imidazole-carboxylate carboxylase, partial [Planctomycetes bacterium]|nr:1-(5-phosphoribosyl)-5-amino-4-imidazole-carboxylate carboxylase [Planctomycetota bacterium]